MISTWCSSAIRFTCTSEYWWYFSKKFNEQTWIDVKFSRLKPLVWGILSTFVVLVNPKTSAVTLRIACVVLNVTSFEMKQRTRVKNVYLRHRHHYHCPCFQQQQFILPVAHCLHRCLPLFAITITFRFLNADSPCSCTWTSVSWQFFCTAVYSSALPKQAALL